MSEATLVIIGLVISVVALYVSIRGLIQLFQRHNSILVIFYIVLLSPIALIHGLILGIFGKSKKKREQEEVERLAKIQVAAHEMAAEKTEK
jgi:hypothetical protein